MVDKSDMTKYDYEKQIASQLPSLTKEGIDQAIVDITEFLQKQDSHQYLMLLGKKINYYTIFKKVPLRTNTGAAKEIVNFISTDSFLTTSLGSVKLVEENPNNYMEIWIGDEHFALFPCDQLVVEI